jgi:ABC-type Fe3+-hydroxamate transport system substrate-binding protein
VRIRDDRNRSIDLPHSPRRIVSLVPSDTLNVAVLGCEGALVGRTDYCELPQGIADRVPSIGGTKNPRIDDVMALAPDLVIANQEENTRSDLERLARLGARVYVSFPRTVAHGIAHLAKLARILGVESDAPVRALLKRAYDEVREADGRLAAAAFGHAADDSRFAVAASDRAADSRRGSPQVSVFCPIWMTPLMTIRGDTFISDMLHLCGARNVFADRSRRYPLAADLGQAPPLSPERVGTRDVRYPRVTLDEVISRAPELVVLPDEPYAFTDRDAQEFRALGPLGSRPRAVVHVSGKDLCWYGARSAEAVARLRAILTSAARGATS